jgi:KaiC/GvpD/RAD55 family RecA-like ATPase
VNLPTRPPDLTLVSARGTYFDDDVERAVLGAMIYSREAIDTVRAMGVQREHFESDANGVVYKAMCRLADTGSVVDPITLAAFLGRHGVLERIGGHEFISGLLDEVPTAANVTHHARLLLLAARRRAGRDDGIRRDEQAAQVGDAMRFLDLTADQFFRFPWPKLDAVVGGLAPGTLSFLAGHPGGGKTSWLLTLITRLVAQGKRVTYAGLETRPNKLRNQIAARTLGLDPGLIFAGRMQQQPDWPEIRDRLKAEVERQRTDERWTEHLCFVPHEHIDVKAAVEIMAEAKDFGSDVVIIDHIDHVTSDGNRSAVQDAHAAVTVFDTAAKRHELVCLAAAQTNNEGDVRDPFLTHRPISPKQIWMGKRKEQVAELFVSIYRPLRKEPPITGEDKLAVREGKPGAMKPLLAKHTTACHVFKPRNLGEARGEIVELGFWRGEVLDEPPRVVREWSGEAGAA